MDTGLTLNYLHGEILKENPKTIKCVSLFHKILEQKAIKEADYVGMELEDKFVVGYGLDYNEKFRELPFLGELHD